jgi:hypothetical protein
VNGSHWTEHCTCANVQSGVGDGSHWTEHGKCASDQINYCAKKCDIGGEDATVQRSRGVVMADIGQSMVHVFVFKVMVGGGGYWMSAIDQNMLHLLGIKLIICRCNNCDLYIRWGKGFTG